MWEPFRLSIQQWAPACQIVYDKFHMKYAEPSFSVKATPGAN
jgi:hypothetical protein